MADAASSSSGRCWKYGVFINFRGEDTRKIFVGHLYRALEQKAIHTFIDSEELRKGNDLSTLLHAIDDSRLSIVVLSKNYASSTWCLKELVKILECMDAQKQIVVPVFYEVDPSHVRNLKGSFAEAFAKHDHSKAEKEEVNSWKTALFRAANLSGWDSRDYTDDGELIEKIVKDTLHKLIHASSSKAHGLVGMDYHLNKMYPLLGVGVDVVRFVGIWGMGGIGKTTIAHAVYDEIAYQFDHCYFLDDVKERFKNKGSIKDLIVTYEDDKGNNTVHMAAKLAPQNQLNLVSGVALQMQRELVWFEEVKKIVQPQSIKMENNKGQTPRELFTKEHRVLMRQGEKWVKGTATSCLLVATIIATVVFSAAFNIPSGTDDKTGKPNFLREKAFLYFTIAEG